VARYYLVQYARRADVCWVSPPECDSAWDEGCFFQDRFDADSGVGFVTCMSDAGLPDPAKEVTLEEGLAWLAGIKRAPKSGPTPENRSAPVVLLTLEEEQAAIRRVATGWTHKHMLDFARRGRAL